MSSRGRAFREVENVETAFNHFDGRVGRAERVITEIEQFARDFGRVRERSKGSVAASIVAWTLLGGLLMWVGNNVLEWLIARLQKPWKHARFCSLAINAELILDGAFPRSWGTSQRM
ncbi:hypothetical protein [Rhizobium sp. EC-SD404]|uniref:hypothetical protein n=1 Tax=Rhizobium sp. EC-SD404 TaxID=2038389 RepID=UPI001253AA21|nr:hypothetical protein [Rhizobium sp. EC-SD404]VVT31909.1 hypothetical protein RHIZ404_230428 [Rhizobium sp. EC-SD404]